jgi:hypothetical protein
MIDWKDWKGKRIFIQLRSGAVYSGNVIDVDDSSKPLIYIKLIDKFGKDVIVLHTEIIKIVEERD